MISKAGSPVLALSDNDRFSEGGFQIVPEVISPNQCESLAAELTGRFRQQQKISGKAMGGLRNVLKICPQVLELANSPNLVSLVEGLAGRKFFPVRGILFDKQPDANWGVPWHQDVAIAVAARIETPGFGPWSVKHGVVHVQPPEHILANMITVRLQLDEGSVDNGALRVIPGSHLQGELDSEQINSWVNEREPVACEVPRGGALVMRPLLLHASSPAKSPSHRRILHLEYAAEPLPNGLKWFEQS